MKIEGMSPQGIIKSYTSNNVRGIEETKGVRTVEDRIEISEVAKSLNSYSIDGNKSNVEDIKNRIENGTYNIDARVTAESIMAHIRGSKVWIMKV